MVRAYGACDVLVVSWSWWCVRAVLVIVMCVCGVVVVVVREWCDRGVCVVYSCSWWVFACCARGVVVLWSWWCVRAVLVMCSCCTHVYCLLIYINYNEVNRIIILIYHIDYLILLIQLVYNVLLNINIFIILLISNH